MISKQGSGTDWLLSKGVGGEQFSDEVKGYVVDIDQRTIEDHHRVMVEVLKEMNLWIKALELLWWVKDITKLNLIPSHFNPY